MHGCDSQQRACWVHLGVGYFVFNREWPSNIGRGRGVSKICRVGIWWRRAKEGGDFFHASLANIFNKCYKKAVFIFKKQLNLGIYKIWAQGRGLNYLWARWVDFLCGQKGGGHNSFWVNDQIFTTPHPPVLNGYSLIMVIDLVCPTDDFDDLLRPRVVGHFTKFLVGGPAGDEKMDPTGSEVL